MSGKQNQLFWPSGSASFYLLLLGFVYLVIGMFQPLNPYDEGVVSYAAERVANGAVPYRDLWIIYAPGQFYSVAGIFHVFGTSVLVERMWDTVMRWGVCLVVLMISRRLVPKNFVYLPFLVTVVFLGWCGSYGYPVIPAMLWSLLTVLLLLQFHSKRRPLLALMGGLTTGTTVLYRHDIGTYTFLMAVVGILFLSFDNSPDKGRRLANTISFLKPLLLYAIGVGLLVVPAALYFIRVVPISELRTDFLEYPRIYSQFRRLPLPPLLPSLSYLHSSVDLYDVWFLFYVPLAIYLISWIRLCRVRLGYTETLGADNIFFGQALLTILGTALMITAGGRPDTIHCLATTIPASILFSGFMSTYLESIRQRWKSSLVMMLLAALSLPFLLEPCKRWCDDILSDAPWMFASPVERARFFRVEPDEADAIEFIQEHVPSNQAIFVGNSQHHRVFISDVLFYFLAQRRAGTRFYDFVPGVITTAPVQQEVISDLERNEVDYVVLRSGFDLGRKEIPADSGVTVLDDYLGREYRKTETFGSYSIWQSQTRRPPLKTTGMLHR